MPSNVTHSTILALNPEYDLTADGKKTNPRFSDGHFQVGGLNFSIVIGSGTSGRAYSLDIQLDESSTVTLADGWSIMGSYRPAYKNEDTPACMHVDVNGFIRCHSRTRMLSPAQPRIQVFSFDTKLLACSLKLKFTFHNVHPYRHYFLNQSTRGMLTAVLLSREKRKRQFTHITRY